METWKEVESKGIKWLVSTEGRIKTVDHETEYTRVRKGVAQTFKSKFKGKLLALVKTKTGYHEVYSMKNGVRVHHLVHRLIGMAYVEGYSKELTINHIDGNKLNNHPSNLEWVSVAKNTQHQWETGLVNLRGENSPSAKLTSKRVVYIRKLLSAGVPAHTIAIVADISMGVIAKIRDGKAWASVPLEADE
jgi:hypothetical protein